MTAVVAASDESFLDRIASMTDDYLGSSSTSGLLEIGGSTTGDIEVIDDEDWFKVSLQAGSTYLFDLSGADSGGGTLGLG